MDLEFKRRGIVSEFESPFADFKTVQVSGEIRSCPLSHHVTRVLPARLREFARFDPQPVIARSKELGCPFCPESIERKTPRFPSSIAPDGGRIRLGETTVFPNAFPYDEFSAVAVVSKEHFLSLNQFTPQLIQDALAACLLYLRRAKAAFPDARQALLNWNYMPQAGAGIVHPHFQAAALSEPTVYYRSIIEKQRRYDDSGKKSLFQDLVARELAEQKRYIAATGPWHWLMAYAPRGLYEFWGIFDLAGNLLAMEPHLQDLAAGIHTILSFLDGKGIQALNMSLYSFYDPEVRGLRNFLSILPRVHFLPLGTSDVNYFNRLHGESITSAPPETVTPEVSPYFKKNVPPV